MIEDSKPDSPYIVFCERDGERASVLHGERGYEVRCDACHRTEYGETLEAALRCFKAGDGIE